MLGDGALADAARPLRRGTSQATPAYFFYPLGGPGGRLAFHPLARKGRLPVHPSCVAIGGTITQFETDPFDPTRVFVAGDDGSVRVFVLPVDAPEDGTTVSEPARVLSGMSCAQGRVPATSVIPS